MAYSIDFSVIIDAVTDSIEKSGLSQADYEAKLDELSSRANDSTKESASLYKGLVFNTPTLDAINSKRYGRIASYQSNEYAEVGCTKADGSEVWIAQKRFQKPPRKIDDDGEYIMVDGHYEVYELTGTFFEVFKLGKTLKEGLLAVAAFREKAGDKVVGIQVGEPEKVETAYNGVKRFEWVYPLNFIGKNGRIYIPTKPNCEA